MKTIELKIEGMSCGHCVAAVRKALSGLPGVEVLEVRIGGARLNVDESKVDERKLGEAVAAAGYPLAAVE
jgi:copper chaperone